MHSQSAILLLLCIGLATGVFQVDESDPGLQKFVHSDTKTLQVFGIMQYRYEGESMTPYCEGVLLGSRFVLTVIACAPSSVRQKFDIDEKKELDFAFVYRGRSNSFDERDFVLTANRRYAIVHLPTRVKNPPERYAYPSWNGNVESRNSDWHIRAEEADDYPIRLSTGYVNPGGAATTNFQNACEFTKRVDLLALKCRTDVFGKKVRSGASFFKLMQGPSIEGVAVTGLVNLEESGKTCKDARVRVTLGLSRASAAGSHNGYLCGRRFNEDDVRDVLMTMRKAGRGETDADVFPTKTIVGTMNMNDFDRYGRDMNDLLAESARHIFDAATIMAVQGVPDLSGGTKEATFFRNEVLGKVSVDFTDTVNNVAFLYKTSEVTKISCKSVRTFGQACFFKLRQATKCFTMINVDLNVDEPNIRKEQISQLRDVIDSVTTPSGCSKVILCLGDFSTGGGPPTQAPNPITDAKFQMAKLYSMRFHDPGPTTRKSHYDRILVSENARLLHRYWPSGSGFKIQADRIEYYANKYIPDMPVARRQFTPMFRNVDLSDHLAVTVRIHDRKTTIGTWNVENFDVTIPTDATFDRKEIQRRNEFITMFERFDVLAVQEVASSFDGNALSGNANSPYVEGTGLYGRNWLISENVKELGFAYNANVLRVVSCENLDVSTSQDAFACTFERKDTKERVTLVSVHVLNEDTSVSVARNYVTRAQEKFPDVTGYVLGDFNMDQAQFGEASARCTHESKSNSDWTFTRQICKTSTDYIWRFGSNVPGVEGCKVLSAELLENAEANEFIFADNPRRERMKAFASWEEISDHYPVYLEISHQD